MNWPKNCILEWDIVKNGILENYNIHSHKKVWWKCSKGCGNHTWETSIHNRVGSKSGCPICINQKVCPYFCNSIWAVRPDLRTEWIEEQNGNMKNYTAGSPKRMLWKCLKGCGNHVWESSVRYRAITKTSCQICTGRKICPCFCNSLWALRPDLRVEWDNTNDSMKKYTIRSRKKVWWKCSKGNCGTLYRGPKKQN